MSYGVAFGLLLPVAAALILAAVRGFPFVDGSRGLAEPVSASGTYRSLLNAGSHATLELLQEGY